MNHHIAVAGADHRHIIDALAEVWEQIRDFDSALAVSLERAFCAQQFCIGAHELIFRFTETGRALLPIQFIQQRFGIESFHVTRSATEEEEDHGFRFGGLLRFAWRKRITALRASLFMRKHRAERQCAKTSAGVAQKLSPISSDTNMTSHSRPP